MASGQGSTHQLREIQTEAALRAMQAELKMDPDKNVEIQRGGNTIVLPENMSNREAIVWLAKNEAENAKIVNVSETIDASPLDGAVALNNVLARRFGMTQLAPGEEMGFFGKFKVPPKLIAVEVGLNRFAQVPWGGVEVPGINGTIKTGFTRKGGRFVFSIHAEVERNSEAAVHEIAEQVRMEIRTNSIYKGQVLKLRFRDDDGDLFSSFDPTHAPTFFDVSSVRPEEAIYNKETEDLIAVSLHHPVLYTERFRELDMPLKQAVLLEGPFGTGKTLAADVLAKLCSERGWTFIYLKDIEDLNLAYEFARQYQPAVLFTEDIDTITSGERTIDMNRVMEMLDGVDAKNSEIQVVFSSNNAERIHEAFIRPGRIDTVISVGPPNAETTTKLARMYGRGFIQATDEQLEDCLAPLVGRTAAFIREAIERAKRFAVSHCTTNQMTILPKDITLACQTMSRQLELTDQEKEEAIADIHESAERLGEGLRELGDRILTSMRD